MFESMYIHGADYLSHASPNLMPNSNGYRRDYHLASK
jgi:hypothetical protein